MLSNKATESLQTRRGVLAQGHRDQFVLRPSRPASRVQDSARLKQEVARGQQSREEPVAECKSAEELIFYLKRLTIEETKKELLK